MPTTLYTQAVSGAPISATDWNVNFLLVQNSLADRGAYVVSGLVPTAGAGLAVSVSAGVASIGARITASGSFSIAGLANNTTVHLYLLDTGVGTSNTTGTQPADSVKLGTCVTAAGAVSSVNILRSSGRQALVRPENQVPGAVGSMGSIDLSQWAAAAADGVTVYGILPSGALPTGALLVLCSGFTPAGTGADIAELVVPYSSVDGTTSITWNVRRIDFRVNVAGGAPAITVEKYTGTGAFSATSVGTVTLGSGAYEGSVTSALGTVASGNKLRFNVGTLGTATGWTIEVLLGA